MVEHEDSNAIDSQKKHDLLVPQINILFIYQNSHIHVQLFVHPLINIHELSLW